MTEGAAAPNWFSQGGEAYARYRPDYPETLAAFLAETAPDRWLAVDIGCGSGQFTCQLAGHFEAVIGLDPSASQIGHALAHDRVRYACASAEGTGLPDHAASLITAAQAAHWFDLPRFYNEVRRIAAPGGVIALVSYGVPIFDAEIDPRFRRFYWEEIGSFWPPERRLVESGYADLPFPFDPLPWHADDIRRAWSLAAFVGYLSTWSATRKVEKAGREALIHDFIADITLLWGDPERLRPVRWPVTLRLGRV